MPAQGPLCRSFPSLSSAHLFEVVEDKGVAPGNDRPAERAHRAEKGELQGGWAGGGGGRASSGREGAACIAAGPGTPGGRRGRHKGAAARARSRSSSSRRGSTAGGGCRGEGWRRTATLAAAAGCTCLPLLAGVRHAAAEGGTTARATTGAMRQGRTSPTARPSAGRAMRCTKGGSAPARGAG